MGVLEEGKTPDVVIELLSESTVNVNKGEKKQIYASQLRVPEYFCMTPSIRKIGQVSGYKAAIIRRLLRTDMPPDQISQVTGLSIDQVEGLRS